MRKTVIETLAFFVLCGACSTANIYAPRNSGLDAFTYIFALGFGVMAFCCLLRFLIIEIMEG